MTPMVDSKESWDRLVLLIASRPREGWEDVYEEVTRREIVRLTPRPLGARIESAKNVERPIGCERLADAYTESKNTLRERVEMLVDLEAWCRGYMRWLNRQIKAASPGDAVRQAQEEELAELTALLEGGAR